MHLQAAIAANKRA